MGHPSGNIQLAGNKNSMDLRGAWVAQSVERPTLDFGLGQDPRVVRSSPALYSMLDVEPVSGAWVAQSVKRPTSTQVMTSRFMSSCPVSGSVLTARSLEPASDSVSPSLSAPPPFMLCLSLSQK